MAVRLEHLFLQHGPPLVLKRDNGSNLNQRAVDEVLARYLVLPLNSPPHYPPYNGGMECAVRELKTPLVEQILAHGPVPESQVQVWAEGLAHALNHRPRCCLKGRVACRVFQDARSARQAYTRRTRREVFDAINELTRTLIQARAVHTQRQAETARRLAGETRRLKHRSDHHHSEQESVTHFPQTNRSLLGCRHTGSPQIVVVLEATVGVTQDDHGFEFLRDCRVGGVRPDARHGQAEKSAGDDVLGGREHGVALSDIDLVTQTRATKVGIELGADPQDRRIQPDRADRDGVKIELDTVLLHFKAQDLADERAQLLHIEIDRPQKVNIARRPSVGAEPVAQEQRPLEDEAVALLRPPQTMQEAFDREKFEELDEGPAGRVRLVLEAILYRMDEAVGARPVHCTASR